MYICWEIKEKLFNILSSLIFINKLYYFIFNRSFCRKSLHSDIHVLFKNTIKSGFYPDHKIVLKLIIFLIFFSVNFLWWNFSTFLAPASKSPKKSLLMIYKLFFTYIFSVVNDKTKISNFKLPKKVMVTQNTLSTCKGKHFKLPTVVNLNKCLTQIRLPCAPFSELPS